MNISGNLKVNCVCLCRSWSRSVWWLYGVLLWWCASFLLFLLCLCWRCALGDGHFRDCVWCCVSDGRRGRHLSVYLYVCEERAWGESWCLQYLIYQHSYSGLPRSTSTVQLWIWDVSHRSAATTVHTDSTQSNKLSSSTISRIQWEMKWDEPIVCSGWNSSVWAGTRPHLRSTVRNWKNTSSSHTEALRQGSERFWRHGLLMRNLLNSDRAGRSIKMSDLR